MNLVSNKKFNYLKNHKPDIKYVRFSIPNKKGEGYIGRYDGKIVLPINFTPVKRCEKTVVLFEFERHYKAFEFKREELPPKIISVSQNECRFEKYTEYKVYDQKGDLIFVIKEGGVDYTTRLSEEMQNIVFSHLKGRHYVSLHIVSYSIDNNVLSLESKELGADHKIEVPLKYLWLEKSHTSFLHAFKNALRRLIVRTDYLGMKVLDFDGRDEIITQAVESAVEYLAEKSDLFRKLCEIGRLEEEIAGAHSNKLPYWYNYNPDKGVVAGSTLVKWVCPLCGEFTLFHVDSKEFTCNGCGVEVTVKELGRESEFIDSWERISSTTVSYGGILELSFKDPELQKEYGGELSMIGEEIKKREEKISSLINEIQREYGTRYDCAEDIFNDLGEYIFK